MNWRNVKLILLREVRDQLRDRRTLFMVFALPLILYPVMGIGMMWMTVTFSEQTRTVVVLNAEALPPPQFIHDGQILDKYFSSPLDAAKLRVITDQDAADNAGLALTSAEQKFLNMARDRLPQIVEMGRLAADLQTAQDLKQPEDTARLTERLDEMRRTLGDIFEDAPVQVLIVVPPQLRAEVESINEQLAAGAVPPKSLTPRDLPLVIENSADEKSVIAYRRVREALTVWEDEVLHARLQQAHLPPSIMTPVNPVRVDIARKEKVSGNVWSKMFPALLVIMAVTGAFYPAIDLGAGEKERGTMETLLISPATRQEIVTGKFLTVMLFSISSALLNLASMGYTGKHMLALRSGMASTIGDLAPPGPAALASIVLLAVPLAALFSALSLAFAMFARSTKEGQYYLLPLLMVTLGLTMFSMNPGIELTPFYSMLPVVGPALLLKSLLQGSMAPGMLVLFSLAVTLSSVCYSLLALWWAIEQFRSEDVLFRDAERFDLRLWLRHLLREKEAVPSFSEAGFCYLLILLLQFASFNLMRDQLGDERRILQLQMIYLLATMATPALLMAVLLTSNPLRSLKLRGCSWKWLLVGPVLACVLQPLATELLSRLRWFFPELPPGAAEVMKAMSSNQVPGWLPWLAIAVTPAICEELAFRGFILSGLQRTHRYRLAAVMSSVAFGFVHMIPQQVFNATLLGLVLAALALRSGSLYPGIIFHFLFNGSQVALARLSVEDLAQWGLDGWIRVGAGGQPEYHWAVLTVCGLVAAPLLYWLASGPVAPGWREPFHKQAAAEARGATSVMG